MLLPPGKDASLEDTLARMSEGLAALKFELEEVEWRNPAPHVWSVTVRDRRRSLFVANGKGNSPEAAKVSALGEFYERLGTNEFFNKLHLGDALEPDDFVHFPTERWFPAAVSGWPAGVLDEHCRNHFDPKDELCGDQLIDFNSDNTGRGVCCLPFVRQKDHKTVWFPVNIISNLYTNNGIASGNTPWEARVHALSEIFERHIKSTIISTGISLPRIPAKVLAQHPRIEEAIKALRVHGFYVDVRDASLGGKFPLVNITLFNRDEGGARSAFGAHPKFAIALERALTELLQGRDVPALSNLPSPTFDLKEAADFQNLSRHLDDSSGVVAWDLFSDDSDYPFTEWNVEGDTEAEFYDLCRRIHAVDMEIYLSDYEHLGIYTCRILVPGMSEVFPVDKLVWSNNNQCAGVRSALLNLDRLDAEESGELLEELEHLNLEHGYLVADLLGVVPDSDAFPGQMNLAELKLLLALHCKELALALEMSQWLLGSEPSCQPLHLELRCLNQLLVLELDPSRKIEAYSKVLMGIYGDALFSACHQAIRGDGFWTVLDSQYPLRGGSEQHHIALAVYKQLHRVKREFFCSRS